MTYLQNYLRDFERRRKMAENTNFKFKFNCTNMLFINIKNYKLTPNFAF